MHFSLRIIYRVAASGIVSVLVLGHLSYHGSVKNPEVWCRALFCTFSISLSPLSLSQTHISTSPVFGPLHAALFGRGAAEIIDKVSDRQTDRQQLRAEAGFEK